MKSLFYRLKQNQLKYNELQILLLQRAYFDNNPKLDNFNWR